LALAKFQRLQAFFSFSNTIQGLFECFETQGQR